MLSDLVRERGVGMMMISHDLSVLADLCDRITVMYAGRVVEEGPAEQVFSEPLHPYSGALSAAFPRVGDPAARFAPAGLPGDPPDPRNLAGWVLVRAAVPARRRGLSPRRARAGDVRGRPRWRPACGSASREHGCVETRRGRGSVTRRPQMSAELSATGLRVEFTTRSGRVARALDGADLVVRAGEVVALVGESGSGKTTLARSLVGLTRPVAGEVPWDGKPLNRSAPRSQGAAAPRAARAAGPAGALNPRHTVYDSVAEGLRVHRLVARLREDRDRAGRAPPLPSAGLRPPEGLFLRYPHELSGGQRQRVLIAGALAVQPQLLIADEPVSSLDASIRGEILALLLRLREELGLGVLVVTHDLGLAWNIADRIAVMYLGRVVESGPTEEVLTVAAAPLHPGAAVGGPRDGAARADRAARRDPRPDAHPVRLPVPPALPGPGVGRGGRRRRRLSWHVAADPARRTPRVTAVPVTWWRPRAPAGSTDGGARMTLQAALPRELYVDPTAWERERERVLLREWTCVGRVADLGLHEPERVAVVEVLGESRARDVGRRRRAARGVQRLPAPRLPAVPDRAGHRAAAVRGEVDPLPLPLVDLRASTARCCVRRTPRRARSTRPSSRCTSSGSRSGAGSSSSTSRPRTRRPLAEVVDRATRTLAHYDLASLVTGLTLTYDVAANWKVLAENYNECYHCGPVHPELSRLVPSFAGGGRGLDWDAGIPHREGAWTFTMSGTTDRAPLPGLDEDERTRHKGELVYPNLMLSCLGRPRGGVHAAARWRSTARRSSAGCCSTRPRWTKATFDPSDAGDLWDLVNRQDWAICESVQRGMSSRAYTHGWFAPMEDDSADIRRWLLPRLDPRSSRRDR